MKYWNMIALLLFILLITIIVSSYIGVKLQEGIHFDSLTVLMNILNYTDDTNAAANMKVISNMGINDPVFTKIIRDNSTTDIQKVSLLKKVISNASNNTVDKDTLSHLWTKNIPLVN